MTTLHVLGSGSSGNALAIVSQDEVLLIDAGFSAREMERRAALAGLDLWAIARQAVSAIGAVLHIERAGGMRWLAGIARFALDGAGRLTVVP